jgi:hypothetical protein
MRATRQLVTRRIQFSSASRVRGRTVNENSTSFPRRRLSKKPRCELADFGLTGQSYRPVSVRVSRMPGSLRLGKRSVKKVAAEMTMATS